MGDDGAGPAPATGEPESTVGTGSAVAVGCTAATLLLIVVGAVVLLLARLL